MLFLKKKKKIPILTSFEKNPRIGVYISPNNVGAEKYLLPLRKGPISSRLGVFSCLALLFCVIYLSDPGWSLSLQPLRRS